MSHEVARVEETNLGSLEGHTTSPPWVAPRSVVATAIRLVTRGHGQCYRKHGAALALSPYLGSRPQVLTRSPQLNPRWSTKLWGVTFIPRHYHSYLRRDLVFDVNDWVYLKISPMKGVMRFGKKGNLSPRYVGQYQILRRIGKVAYELESPNELASVHPVFHVSLLKKCDGDPTTIVLLGDLGVKENLYKVVPIEILDQQVKMLKNKEVASVRVLWRNLLVEGATWEAEVDMMSRYPHLLPSTPSPT
ncbi:hypothetical protein MTR67_048632 [Solanum verrucosum]|uniref:Tf2-1-like SH3-like domain-containing protein n=1 Tax=Solanum verrucosum TaxID=315347 RepID=A0AAF0ZWM7_SOLVR|nr:hypothetical protein MTR67_048632 [Solanum verrucosum]